MVKSLAQIHSVKVKNCKYYGCWFCNLSPQVTTYYEIIPKGVITKSASFLIDSGQGPLMHPQRNDKWLRPTRGHCLSARLLARAVPTWPH